MKKFELNTTMAPEDLAAKLGLIKGSCPQGLMTYLDKVGGGESAFTFEDKFLVFNEDAEAERLAPRVREIATPTEW